MLLASVLWFQARRPTLQILESLHYHLEISRAPSGQKLSTATRALSLFFIIFSGICMVLYWSWATRIKKSQLPKCYLSAGTERKSSKTSKFQRLLVLTKTWKTRTWYKIKFQLESHQWPSASVYSFAMIPTKTARKLNCPTGSFFNTPDFKWQFALPWVQRPLSNEFLKRFLLWQRRKTTIETKITLQAPIPEMTITTERESMLAAAVRKKNGKEKETGHRLREREREKEREREYLEIEVLPLKGLEIISQRL